MKKFLFSTILLFLILSLKAQQNKQDVLQSMEQQQQASQQGNQTATLTMASRLFKAKDDLTSVIMVIPSGTVVDVLGADSTYFIVNYDSNYGYILKKQAVLNKETPKPSPATQGTYQNQSAQSRQQTGETSDRYVYLESKYGTTMANRLFAGKIWKGMNSEMVKDSWGPAKQINREVKGNDITEEWLYRTTWLFFVNNSLSDWGPIKK